MANPVITIDFQAQLARLELEAKKGARAVRDMAGDIESALSSAKAAVFGLLGAFGVGSFAAGIKGASEAADAAAKMGDRFGVASQSMIGLQAAGELAGASSETLALAMKNVAQRSTEAIQKGGEAAETFRQLKLDAAELVKLPLDEQLLRVTDALGQVENANLRNTLANEVFGKSYGDVMGLVVDGSAAVRQAAEDAQAFGLAINRIEAAKLEAANDAMTRSNQAMRGIFTTIALNLSPAVKAVADGFADAAKEGNGFRTEIASGMEKASTAVAAGAWFIERLRFAWAGVKVVVAEVITAVLEHLVDLDRGYTETMNRIADSWIGKKLGMQARQYSEALGEMADVSRNRAAELQAELQNLALSTKSFAEWEQQVKAAFARASAAIESEARSKAARAGQLGKTGVEIEKGPEKARKDTWAEELEKRIERVRAENLGALGAEMEGFAQRQDWLNQARGRDLIDEDFYNAQSAALKEAHEKKLTEITDAEARKRWGINQVYRQLDLQSSAAFFGQMAVLMQSKSRAMFEIGKAAAIAETIIQTYRAAQGAYAAFAKIHPGLGIAAAAAATAAGMVRVQQIRATSLGGAGAAMPTYGAQPGTAVPAAPISPVQTSEQAGGRVEINVNVYGGVYGSGGIDELGDRLVDILRDRTDNRDVLLFGPNSRQATVVGAS